MLLALFMLDVRLSCMIYLHNVCVHQMAQLIYEPCAVCSESQFSGVCKGNNTKGVVADLWTLSSVLSVPFCKGNTQRWWHSWSMSSIMCVLSVRSRPAYVCVCSSTTSLIIGSSTLIHFFGLFLIWRKKSEEVKSNAVTVGLTLHWYSAEDRLLDAELLILILILI